MTFDATVLSCVGDHEALQRGRAETDVTQIALKLHPPMEKIQKRVVQVLDECFENGKGYSMT